MAELFNVVFAGEISGRADPAAVRANVGKLFNASESVLDRLFSGQPVAVKKMVDRATAMKLRALMKQAGAETRMVPVDEQGRPLAAGTAPAAPAPSAAPAETMAERVDRLAEQHAREEAARPKPDAPPPPADVARVETWALFPPGWILSVPLARPAPVLPKITGISMAATGSDLVAASERVAPVPVKVDISGISMAAAGSDVLREEERRKVEPVQVDLSGISVAEVGAPLDEIKEEKVLLNPDISHISLV